ncbi:ATP-binding cassette sub-family G member 1 [Condylostylus longicornis]|uniref:ATP-binding cassette sub-family G member 1 n=1 Tax=Condylostylus longicornis TaxID=2530218 RepID=UPI00244E2347|nr:ATP-binding cassette sub-family G member 1 [Condylostylus longicornis]XP_055371518.1 ATP-binding cassette sub-family G member 1 [Condylostylus longicornis]
MSGIKQKRVDITFKNLTYIVSVPKTKAKKKILNNVYGQFKSGELNAIMGPSGAGKSSLMNILTGFIRGDISGDISFGAELKNSKVCCYILQDDLFFPWFTVEEVMLLAATLKISNKSLPFEEKKTLIDDILKSLHLSNARNTKCAKLSGGQKKRLSIALELVDNPRVIFLDEPTTGLDASSSMDLIRLLKDLCSEDRTIVCTIHQPSASIYELFGHIYVLNKGMCVYQGSPKNTVPYLQSVGVECPAYHNPADILLEVTNGEYGDYTKAMVEAAKDTKWRRYDLESNSIHSKIKERSDHNGTKKIKSYQNNHIYPPDELFRLWVLLGRCYVQFYRDWTATHLRLIAHICCGILMGLLYGDSGINASKTISNTGLFLVTIVYLWYTTSMPGVLRFPMEIATIRKETFNKWYNIRTYYMATLITSIPMHIIYSMIFGSIIYFSTYQPYEIDRYGKFILVHIMTTIAADGFGILIGTFAGPVNGTFLGAVLCCFMLIYSGFFIFFAHMSIFMRTISYLSPQRFAFESIVLTLYGDNRSNMICPDEEIYCHFKNPKMLLSTLGVTDESSYGFNILMLIIQFAIFRLVAFFGLKRALK